jgi:hypothetical protein
MNTIDKWISTGDRLPEKLPDEISVVVSARVLVFTGFGIMTTGVYDYEYQKWWLYKSLKNDTVTHWMPLPEPPCH